MSGYDTHSLPERNAVPNEYRWNLEKLFPDDASWEKGLEEYRARSGEVGKFKGTLGRSAADLFACLDFMNELEKLDERLGSYGHLRTAEDAGNSSHQDRFARYMSVASKVQATASYQTPEIQAIPDEKIAAFLKDPILEPYVIPLSKILRFKPHVLTENEEKIMALQIEANQTAQKTFTALTDVDFDFGTIDTPEGPKPLSHAAFSSFLQSHDRELRKKAYFQFYEQFEKHKNSIASLYAGSVHLDIYRARARNHPSARAMALFPDKVPETVYDNLVGTVNANLEVLHRYYALKRKALGLDTLRHYDVYVPIVKDVTVRHTYEQAVEVIHEALAPLGDEYRDTLRDGLLGRWVDRYENKGKRSGAFSAGSYFGDPHILMNYKDDNVNHVFTLAHEGGHSMHSWYSVRNNPFQYYNYTIFEAEVASTFNEEFIADYLFDRAAGDSMKAYLIGKQVDDMIGTLFRQTMFAEFEHVTHSMVEEGKSLTVESLRAEYRKLQEKYFGSEMALEECSDLEGLRIPHFYRAFYVYKYATGMSAAIALARTVKDGGESDRERYLGFLKSGGSKYPLESLEIAGVDMSRAEPVQAAIDKFGGLVGELEGLL